MGTGIFDDCFYRVTEFQVSEIREPAEQLEAGTTIQSFETVYRLCGVCSNTVKEILK